MPPPANPERSSLHSESLSSVRRFAHRLHRRWNPFRRSVGGAATATGALIVLIPLMAFHNIEPLSHGGGVEDGVVEALVVEVIPPVPDQRETVRGKEKKEKRTVHEGEASYYCNSLSGNPTASGEIYDPELFTAAHRTLPLGTRVRVTNLRSGKSVIVRINDRGPFVEQRVIDLSQAAAREIGMIHSGVAQVRIERLPS